ncbi:adenosine monophosphate deaminase, partial [Aphelenchoides avenae]
MSFQQEEEMASRKNPHNGFFGTPPSINFFSGMSMDDENSDPIADQEAAEKELREKVRRMTVSENGTKNGAAEEEENFENGGSSGHVVSSPYELSHYPIEVNEQKKAIQRQISTRSQSMREQPTPRVEFNNSLCVSPETEECDVIERELSSPQHVEMHAFRDAIDVNYQRMALTGEELSGVPLEDLQTAAKHLIEAMQIRMEYMEKIGNTFPPTTKNFITNNYPKNLPKYRRKNTELSSHTSFHPPEPPMDHWGTNDPLPVYDKIYKLGRKRGV